MSPALWDTYQKRNFRVSLYLFRVQGEGVSISWQSMSGEGEKINGIIALTTWFSYLNWQHQLKLFHAMIHLGACLDRSGDARGENSLQLPVSCSATRRQLGIRDTFHSCLHVCAPSPLLSIDRRRTFRFRFAYVPVLASVRKYFITEAACRLSLPTPSRRDPMEERRCRLRRGGGGLRSEEISESYGGL